MTSDKRKPIFSKKVIGNSPSNETAKAQPVPADTVRLSCDISRENHRSLRMTAAATDKTILQVVTTLIENHCANERNGVNHG